MNIILITEQGDIVMNKTFHKKSQILTLSFIFIMTGCQTISVPTQNLSPSTQTKYNPNKSEIKTIHNQDVVKGQSQTNLAQNQMAKKLIDALYDGAGSKQSEYRINHAKGFLVQGMFYPSSSATNISKAEHFQKPVPIFVRLSNSSSIPNIAENDPRSAPKGIALRFYLSDGRYTDLIGHSVEAFPADTPEEFNNFLAAVNQISTQPQAFQTYLNEHPAAKQFFSVIGQIPESYAKTGFYPLHTYLFSNHLNQKVYGRYYIQPVLGEKIIDKTVQQSQSADFLKTELSQRLKTQKVEYKLILELANPEDNIMKISQAWAGKHRSVDLGTIALESIEPNSNEAQKNILFDITNLTEGIQSVGDPMFIIRKPAYSLSYEKRHAQNMTPPPNQK